MTNELSDEELYRAILKAKIAHYGKTEFAYKRAAIEFAFSLLKAQEQWISVEDRLPETENKFNESDAVLCYAASGQFVGWYNSKLKQWFVSHFLAPSTPLNYDHIPTHWMPLRNHPNH